MFVYAAVYTLAGDVALFDTSHQNAAVYTLAGDVALFDTSHQNN